MALLLADGGFDRGRISVLALNHDFSTTALGMGLYRFNCRRLESVPSFYDVPGGALDLWKFELERAPLDEMESTGRGL